MGIHSGLFSKRLRKSAGNLTFSTWRGIPVFKQKATEVANPNSPAQRTARSIMRKLSQIGSSANYVLRKHLDRQATKMSGFNLFAKINYGAVTGSPTGNATVNLPSLKFSQGSLKGGDNVVVGTASGGALPITFDAPSVGDTDENDLGTLLAINDANQLVITLEDDFAKTAGSASLDISDVASGTALHLYLYFRNPLNSEMSPTQYLGMATA